VEVDTLDTTPALDGEATAAADSTVVAAVPATGAEGNAFTCADATVDVGTVAVGTAVVAGAAVVAASADVTALECTVDPGAGGATANVDDDAGEEAEGAGVAFKSVAASCSVHTWCLGIFASKSPSS
jgi:hypothetical protein